MLGDPPTTPLRRKQIGTKALTAFALVWLPAALACLVPSLDRDYPPEVGLGVLIALLLPSVIIALSALRDARRRPELNARVPATTLVLAGLFTLAGILTPAPLAWVNYVRVPLGATEAEVTAMPGTPAQGWHQSRHIGGITSPGSVGMPYAERGLPLDLVRQREVHESRVGDSVIVTLPAAAAQQAGSPTVRMRQ